MTRKNNLLRRVLKQARSSWTLLLTYIYVLGGFIETQTDFVDKYVPEKWRAPAWIGAMLLIGLARMRSIVVDVKASDPPKGVE